MSNKRVFFLALDSADSQLLCRWMDAGFLPNLAKLRENSACGELGVPRGFGSDAIWPSVYTGVDPSGHGRYYHQQQLSGSYRADRKRRTDLMHQTVWEAVSATGRTVSVIDLPKSPFSASLNGVEVVDWRSHYSYKEEFKTSPVSLEQEIRDRYGEPRSCPCLESRYTDPDPGAFAGKIDAFKCDIKATVALLLDQMQGERWDLLMAGLRSPHCAGHQLWHMHDASHPLFKVAADSHRDPLLEVYMAIDEAVGDLLAALPEDVAIVVFAGPGMGPAYVRRELLEGILAALGTGRHSAASALTRSLKRLWRRLPQAWRRPLSRLAHSTESRLKEKDHSGRPFYPVQTNDSVGGIRVNLRDREPEGMIEPGLLGEVCDELVARIADINIVDTGEPLALDIFRTNTVYNGEYLDMLPDILIDWNHNSPITAIESSDIGIIRQPLLPEWSGTHRGRGLVLIKRPGGESGCLDPDASVLDIAPAIATLCGVELDASSGRCTRLVKSVER